MGSERVKIESKWDEDKVKNQIQNWLKNGRKINFDDILENFLRKVGWKSDENQLKIAGKKSGSKSSQKWKKNEFSLCLGKFLPGWLFQFEKKMNFGTFWKRDFFQKIYLVLFLFSRKRSSAGSLNSWRICQKNDLSNFMAIFDPSFHIRSHRRLRFKIRKNGEKSPRTILVLLWEMLLFW